MESEHLIAVDCPKCEGKMVPLSSCKREQINYSPAAEYSVVAIHFAEWRCVKCNHSVSNKYYT